MFATRARAVKRTSAPFNPLTQVTPLHAVWADDPLWTTGKPADGGNVSAMRNSTGGGDPAQGNTTFQPIYRQSSADFGSRGCVEFNKTDNDRLVVDITDIALPFKALAVYRHLDVDYESGSFVNDVYMTGPALGLEIRF